MTLVVKIGGSSGSLTTALLDEIATTVTANERLVLVHGGSDLTNRLAEQLGQPVRTLTAPNGMTSRYTDPETLRTYAMAVAGQINTEIVAGLQQRGVNALGLAGVDGRLLVARRKEAIRTIREDHRVQIVRDDYTGQIEAVNAHLLGQLLDLGYTPVVAPLALGTAGERLNVDGDRAAAAIAGALQAERLVILTNVPGLLRDPGDPTTLIPRIAFNQMEEFQNYAQGRMRKKLQGAREALAAGVQQVLIGRGSLRAVLSGTGTRIEHDRILVEGGVSR